jgi:hypothetical protein
MRLPCRHQHIVAALQHLAAEGVTDFEPPDALADCALVVKSLCATLLRVKAVTVVTTLACKWWPAVFEM